MRHFEVEDDEPYVVIEKHQGSVGSFLIGIAVGAGIALLLAPQSGVETRQGIRRGVRRTQTAVRGAVDDVSDSVTDSITAARTQVEDRIAGVRQAVDVKKQQVARAMEAGRVAAQQARDELERRIAETKAAYQAGAGTAGARGASLSTAPGTVGGDGSTGLGGTLGADDDDSGV